MTRLAIASGTSLPDAEYVARREAGGGYAVYGRGEDGGQTYCATCTSASSLSALGELCRARGIACVTGADAAEAEELQVAVPLVNEESLSLDEKIRLLLIDSATHPSLVPLLRWVREDRPQVEVLGRVSATSVPRCFAYAALRVEGLAGVARVGGRLLAVDSVLIEPAFTAVFEKHYIVKLGGGSKAKPASLVQPCAGQASPARRTVAAHASPLPASRIRRAWPPEDAYSPAVPSLNLSQISASSQQPSSRADAPEPPESVLETNRRAIRHHVLLALRSRGIDARTPDFGAYVEQLTSGCKFTFRKRIAAEVLGAGELAADISSNMNHLKIGLGDL